ncbi:uncharacterized protein LOC130982450 [Arachis stenosperma]|uniref:uncharacterized protein LOC130982450 n=1 Tax=Arachis stenosperma TaxID=217475 RepID=UPI0025ABB8CA|nr:uncharacterized protein LOC130982450 [Arachis stenosperma]
MNRMRVGFRISSAAVAAAAEKGGVWRRSMSTVSKAKEIIEGKKGKNRKATSELCNYLGIPHQSRSEMALTLSKFMKLYNARSPGIKKDDIWEKNLNTLLRGKTSIGFPEVARILSPEFGQQGGISTKDSNMDSHTDNTKGKGSKKKGKSSKK